MALNYYYKVNPKVARHLSLTSIDRYTFADGTMLLWVNDMKRLDAEMYLTRREEFLAKHGIVELTAPQTVEEQRNPSITLPEASDPDFRWEAHPEAVEVEAGGENEEAEGAASPAEEEEGGEG